MKETLVVSAWMLLVLGWTYLNVFIIDINGITIAVLTAIAITLCFKPSNKDLFIPTFLLGIQLLPLLCSLKHPIVFGDTEEVLLFIAISVICISSIIVFLISKTTTLFLTKLVGFSIYLGVAYNLNAIEQPQIVYHICGSLVLLTCILIIASVLILSERFIHDMLVMSE